VRVEGVRRFASHVLRAVAGFFVSSWLVVGKQPLSPLRAMTDGIFSGRVRASEMRWFPAMIS